MDPSQFVPQNCKLEIDAMGDPNFMPTFSTLNAGSAEQARIRHVADNALKIDGEPTKAFNKSTSEVASEHRSSNENGRPNDFTGQTYNQCQQFQPSDIQPWVVGDPCRFPVPSNEDPWDQCFKSVMKFDEEMCRGWREEVDTLLVFAGLFSAAVTAFTIESYQWLQEDPKDVQIQLLQRISDQLANESNTTLTAKPPLQADFTPSPTSVHVNVFWFTSLTLSLSAVLTGILCKQWLREYQRYEGLSAKDAFPVRQLRYEGLLAWHVPGVLSTLPLLLQASLVLFFGGLLDLLWTINSLVAVVATIVVGISMTYLVATTIIPSIQSFCDISTSSSLHGRENRGQCAFKSPQSWAFHLLLTWIISLYSNIQQYLFYGTAMNYLQLQLNFWHSEDANWVKYDQRWQKHGPYVQRGINWFEKNFARGNHNLGAIYNIYHCLESLETDVSAACVSQIIEDNWDPLLPLVGLVQPTLKSFQDPVFSYDVPEALARDMVLASYLVVHHKAHDNLSLQCMERCARMLNDLPTSQGLVPVILEILNVVLPTSMAPNEFGAQITAALSKGFHSDYISTSDQLTFWAILQHVVRNHQHQEISLHRLFYHIGHWLTRTMSSPILPNLEKRIALKHCAIGVSSMYRLLRLQASFSETESSAGDVPGEDERARSYSAEYLEYFVNLLDGLIESTGGPDVILSLWEARNWKILKKELLEEFQGE